jgi:hypothetical protein
MTVSEVVARAHAPASRSTNGATVSTAPPWKMM